MFIRRKLKVALIVLIGAILLVGNQALPASAADASLPLKVNFQTDTTTTPAGYVGDSGAAYDDSRGYGWVAATGGAPTSFVGNGRERGVNADKRLDTFMQPQLASASPGVHTVGAWKASVPNGAYTVTAAAGDPSYTDSHHVIRADGVTVVDFTPTTTARFLANTITVNVTDGFLNIDFTGGTNTKINYLEITPTSATSSHVTAVTPTNGATNVDTATGVTVQLNNGVDPTTANSTAFKLIGPNNQQIAGFYNTDGAYSNATFVPSVALATNTTYTVQTNSSLKDPNGNSYDDFTSTFTTGSTTAPPPPVTFTRSVFTALNGPTAMTLGPDGKLYVATNTGQLQRYTLDGDGKPVGTPQSINTFANSRLISSLRFDPASTASNLKLWVVNNALCGTDSTPNRTAPACADFTGAISTLSGPDLTTRVDVITGLPRSIGNHMTNGIDFGPDGKLYIAQAAENGYGAPDSIWGNRGEDPLSAAVLVVDPSAITTTPLNVNTSTGYNPSTGLLKTYATGIRNPYTLLWASNGKLYAPVNESANGNTPAGPGGTPPALNDLPAFNDYFTQIVSGKYYGHPNPTRNEYGLNGGNPTSGTDPFEVSQYPVGTQPNSNWRQPDMNLGAHRSMDGVTEFKSNVFGTALQGQLLATEYASGKDLVAIKLDANGKPTTRTTLATGFYNPLSVVSDPVTGHTYVAEYGADPTGNGGQIALLAPNTGTVTPPTPGEVHVNFQTAASTTPAGYQADSGAAYNSTRGYGWTTVAGAPLDLTGNGRERNVATDKRLDTFMQFQLSSQATGVHTEGRWQADLPNGTYDVTVGVGDPSFLDSHDVIRAEGNTIVDFTPTSGTNNRVATATVTITDGQLNIDGQGGTNTKIDYIDVVPTGGGTDPGDPPPSTLPVVNFQTQTSTAPAGYSADYGQAFDATRGYGWQDLSGNALSLVGNGRDRGSVASDARLNTFMSMQLTAAATGVHTQGRFQATVPNGTYNVTVGVGDPSFTDSHDVIRAEGTKIVDFTPTTATPTQIVTVPVTVTDGNLTLDPVGGTNTKLSFVKVETTDGTPPPVDTTAPSVTVTPSGTTDSTGAYVGSATVTINATDTGSGVASTTYTLDSNPQTQYGVPGTPFTVTGVGTHTVTAFSKDVAGNTSANVVATFKIAAASGPSPVVITTPNDFMGLGSRLVMSTVKSQARAGQAFTIKNVGSSSLKINSLSFSGVQGKDFQLATGTPTSFTLAPNGTQSITVNYRPTAGGFGSGITYISQASLVINTDSTITPQSIVTLGGLNARDYESYWEPSLEDMVNALGWSNTNVAVTNKPQGDSISPSNGPVGDEVISAYWKKLNTTQNVGLYPLAHYSGKSSANSTNFGWYAKGSTMYNAMYQFIGGSSGTNDGYGQNQTLLPGTTNTARTFNPSGSFGFRDGEGNRSDDNLNAYLTHNVRFFPAKDGQGNVIPGSYIVGDDIGVPQNNAAKNFDYQDYVFLLTNVQPDGGSDQPPTGVVTKTLDFNGGGGGIADTGFTSAQGAQVAGNVSLSGGQLKIKTSSDSDTSHTNALQLRANAQTNFSVQARLVGPFDAINAGSEQQGVYFGPNGSNYIKAEVEWNPTQGKRKLSIWREVNGAGDFAKNSSGTPYTIDFPGGNANTVDFHLDGDPVARTVTVSYSINGGSFVKFMAGTASAISVPDAWFTPTTAAGIVQSHQGGGAQFTASYDSFAVVRRY